MAVSRRHDRNFVKLIYVARRNSSGKPDVPLLPNRRLLKCELKPLSYIGGQNRRSMNIIPFPVGGA